MSWLDDVPSADVSTSIRRPPTVQSVAQRWPLYGVFVASGVGLVVGGFSIATGLNYGIRRTSAGWLWVAVLPPLGRYCNNAKRRGLWRPQRPAN